MLPSAANQVYRRQRGQSLVESTVALALIAILVISVTKGVGTQTRNLLALVQGKQPASGALSVSGDPTSGR